MKVFLCVCCLSPHKALEYCLKSCLLHYIMRRSLHTYVRCAYWVLVLCAPHLHVQAQSYGESSADLTLDLVDAMHLYVDIGANTLFDAPDSTATSFFRSPDFQIGTDYPIPLGRSKRLYLLAGAAIQQSGLDWKNPYALQTATPRTTWNIIQTPHRVVVNRLNLTYLKVPLALLFSSHKQPGQGWNIAIGGSIGYLAAVRQKIKLRTENDDVLVDKVRRPYPMRPWQYTLEARLGYNGLNFYGRYQLAPIFEHERGPVGMDHARYFSLGIRLTP